METKAFYMISMAIAGCLCGVFFMWLGERYYEKRFEKSWENSFRQYMIPVVLCAFAAVVFVSYDYFVTDALALIGYIAATWVIGRIDRFEQIIPNCILIILMIFRSVLYVMELIIASEQAVFNIKRGLYGMLFWTVMFTVIRLVCKDKIGMGDIKIMIVAGYYLGIYRCSLMMLVVLVIAVADIILKMILKKMKAKDYISFGPYISIGGYIALILGI